MKKPILYILLLALVVFITCRETNRDYYNAVTITGATPIALNQEVPKGFRLEVEGLVERPCTLGTSSLRAFATTRIRTSEVSASGAFEGAYIHVGIPVFNILEGIAPAYPEGRSMKIPTDYVVTFKSESGEKAAFTYNELIYTNDSLPPVLAFYREELLPTRDPEKYTKNIRRKPLTALRLILPREPDTSRYLDNVVSMELSLPETPDELLPLRQKGIECAPEVIYGISGGSIRELSFENLETVEADNWVRIGHGRGFSSISSAQGYRLKDFLEKNFPSTALDEFFLFVSCDGYRCLFSAREIFTTTDGDNMILVTGIDDGAPRGGLLLACTNDYFIDRSIWGISHVVRLP